MRLQEKVKNQPLIVLVDSGSTHNFIDCMVAKRLGCELQSIKDLQVIVANGDRVHTWGVEVGGTWVYSIIRLLCLAFTRV